LRKHASLIAHPFAFFTRGRLLLPAAKQSVEGRTAFFSSRNKRRRPILRKGTKRRDESNNLRNRSEVVESNENVLQCYRNLVQIHIHSYEPIVLFQFAELHLGPKLLLRET
jgi:hypothetical protein